MLSERSQLLKTVGFNLYETLGIVKSIKAVGRLLVVQGWKG